MYLFFDTETTGLPKDYNLPPDAGDNWPRLVSIAWATFSPEGKLVEAQSFIIAPDNFDIPQDVIAIHGITNEIANKYGLRLETVLNNFSYPLTFTPIIIAHNFHFDNSIVASEFIRNGTGNIFDFLNFKSVCTAELSQNILGKRYRLKDLHKHFFGVEHEGQHGALADTLACAKCFFELAKIDKSLLKP